LLTPAGSPSSSSSSLSIPHHTSHYYFAKTSTASQQNPVLSSNFTTCFTYRAHAGTQIPDVPAVSQGRGRERLMSIHNTACHRGVELDPGHIS
jgi:hypothetical protein